MKLSTLKVTVLVLTAMGMLTGFGLGDVTNKLSGTDNCDKSSDPKRCEKERDLKTAGKIVAIGIAAKLIYDMIIDYTSSQVSDEDKVINDYKKVHEVLPPEPDVVQYSSTLKPSNVVSAGKAVIIDSDLVVVPSAKSKTVDIQERIDIYDNEKTDKTIKSMTKPVNAKTKKSGAFKNEFKFTLPVGMPQGVYPIKTMVLVNGKAFKPAENKMQLVLNVDNQQHYRIVAVNK
ncbi:MAG: hypothetical protein HY080_08515 [Gammaproteobacteria bacterium]|nr:hypothetical protein [Gammaproteobacteria bacterium]